MGGGRSWALLLLDAGPCGGLLGGCRLPCLRVLALCLREVAVAPSSRPFRKDNQMFALPDPFLAACLRRASVWLQAQAALRWPWGAPQLEHQQSRSGAPFRGEE